jgi:thiol-disulfide isomerase/thioredoxin
MTKKIIIILAVIATVALGVVYGRGLLSVHEGFAPPASLSALVLEKQPKPAPKVSFADKAGTRHALSSLQGRWVLLNLWATWCGPCVNELPQLARLAHFTPGLRVLTVNWREKPDAVDAFLKSHNAGTLPTFIDDTGEVMKGLKAFGLPMTVLIDPKGNIVAKAAGPAEWDTPESVAYFKRVAQGS